MAMATSSHGENRTCKGETEDGQGHDGENGQDDDRDHDDRSPSQGCGGDALRLPPAMAAVDRDQPGSHPDVIPATSGSALTAVRDADAATVRRRS